MKKIKLGKSDVEVTPLAFGAWAIGGWMWGGAEEKDAVKALHAAYDNGLTSIDTAPVYGFGRSEEIIGKAMADKPRESYELLTKFGMDWETGEGEYFFDTEDFEGNPVKMYKNASRDRVIKECEDSLRRLKTDYIDLYQIHWPDATTPIEETFGAVAKLLKDGKIRAAGVCNYNVEQVSEANKFVELATNQVPYSLIRRDIENDVVPQAVERGMGILPYSPLQRGILTGKIKPGHEFNEGDTRADSRFYTNENIKRINQMLNKIRPMAEKHDATLAQVIINWTMNQPGIACVLVGARNEQQVLDNIKSTKVNLSKEEIDYITKLSDELELLEK